MSPDAPSDDRSACTPCRGTGSLTSNKGGEPHQVTCPWCEGTGMFHAGHDAQIAAEATDAAASEAATPTAG